MSDPDPRSTYEQRLTRHRAAVEEHESASHRLADGRLASFSCAVLILIVAGVSDSVASWWLLLPLGVFGWLVWRHGRVQAAADAEQRRVDWYERGLGRLSDDWVGRGESSTRWEPADHDYAADLDVFGAGSLFELLCTARTDRGRATLSAWLLRAADPETVRARQAAVRELTPRVDFREDLGLLGSEVAAKEHGAALAEWGRAQAGLRGGALKALAWLLPVAAVAALILWGASVLPVSVFLVVVMAEAGLYRLLRDGVVAVTGTIDRAEREIELLGLLLGRVEEEPFESPLLTALRERLETDGDPPSASIAALRRRVDLLDAGKNQFFAPVAGLLLWPIHCAHAIEDWRRRVGPSLGAWQQAVGEFEALAALATYAYERPEATYPEIVEGDARVEGTAVGHPLLPRGVCIRNDVSLGGERRAYIVSGSNMSGKSTLLRAVGTNVVLALAGAPVRAERLVVSQVALGASIRATDSLKDGESRFYAEVKRIGCVADLARESEGRCLFLLDEIFHGTNSHDRRIGAGALLRGLVETGAVGFMTTHDLALARIADEDAEASVETRMEKARIENVHFEDQLLDGRMSFDYQMRPGVVTRSNALELMRAVGLDV